MLPRLLNLLDRHPRLAQIRHVLAFAARRSEEVQLRQVASSLTLTTVLSMVPLLAIGLAVFAAFPLFARYRSGVEHWIGSTLLPGPIANVLLRYLDLFTASAGRLTAIGVAFLAVTAMMMIVTIDHALNDIFRVRVRRPLLQRLLIYWALITLGPLVIGLSLSLTSYIATASSGVVERLPFWSDWLLDASQLLLSGLAFTLLYLVVPYRRVEWRDALTGGFTAALLSELLRAGFTGYITAGNATSIYGAFAVVPIFLLWVYLGWLVTLFGAAVTATLPQLRSTRFADQTRAGDRFLTSAALLRVLLVARLQGPAEVELNDLARAVRCAPDDTEALMQDLRALGYAQPLAGGRGSGWIMSCDPARMALRPLFEKLALDPANTLLAQQAFGLEPLVEQALGADWLSRPLAVTLARPLVPVSAQAAR